ncbi:MAG: HXXEE domain-containing protein [Cystobacterineae bacterium]|nr:HXXEE domain-containing protein [Cystobacterineae bacterium]
MDKHTPLVWLLPIVFMLHDFEEIIFFESWMRKNKAFLEKKFPKMPPWVLAHASSLSTPAFALAVAGEFVLLSLITWGCVLFDNYGLWLALFMVFFIHLFVHVGQWLVLRRYIPAIYTTFLGLVYGAYVVYTLLVNKLFPVSEMALWTVVGVGLAAPSFVFLHKLAAWFDKRLHP